MIDINEQIVKSSKKNQLDPDLFVHPSDRIAMKLLRAIPGFSQVTKSFMKIWDEQQFKIINMSTNLKLSEKQMKKYYDMLLPICDKLGIEIPEMYVSLDVRPNAYTYGDTHPFIVLTSGLFETLPEELIPSVIAHECGHIACHHTLYMTMGRMILDSVSAFTSGLGNIAIYPIQLAFAYWMRCSEFSADRAAMIYDGNSHHVFEIMMRFAGYDKDLMIQASPEAFMEQAKEYRKMVDGNGWNKTLEFIRFKEYDHPLNAVRALEAYEWEQSDRFRTILAYLENPDSVRMPIKLRPQKYCGKESEVVRDEFISLGFENVEMRRTTETTEKAKAGCVVSVMIDGAADCDDDYYLQSSDIIITYYEPKTQDEIACEHYGEICMNNNSKFFIGKHYDYVFNFLRDIGFNNIEIKEMAISKIGFLTKPDMVAKIIINGTDGFELNSWHKPEEKILIYYYVKV